MKKQNIKFYFLFPAVITLALVLSGCGKSVSEKVGEKAAEKLLEAQSGGKADVDLSGGNIKVETDEGKMESGEDVKLPADFPSDVYVIDGKIKSTIADQGSEGYTISIETDKSIGDVSAVYQEKFKADGWKITGTMNFGDSATVAAEKDDRTASVILGQTDGKTNVIITVGKK